MVGKYFLIALVCVSLAQVQGNELEEAIKNGLIKVRALYGAGQKKINASIEEVGYKSKAIERKSVEFIKKSVSMQEGAKEALRNVARAMEEKAKETNKPESVFQCIRKTEKNANNEIQTLTNNFKSNVTSLEKLHLGKIQTESKPLFELKNSLTAKYEKVTKTIKSCDTTSCVDAAVKRCAKWLEEMYITIGKILSSVGHIVGDFAKQASEYLNNNNKHVAQVKSDGIRNIKKCVFG